jgi:hypothetical protein
MLYSLSTIQEIVEKKDASYDVAAQLLTQLKLALVDIYNIRNEPLILKLQNGTISPRDVLNDTESIKMYLKYQYKVDERITDAFLDSQIDSIEVKF